MQCISTPPCSKSQYMKMNDTFSLSHLISNPGNHLTLLTHLNLPLCLDTLMQPMGSPLSIQHASSKRTENPHTGIIWQYRILNTLTEQFICLNESRMIGAHAPNALTGSLTRLETPNALSYSMQPHMLRMTFVFLRFAMQCTSCFQCGCSTVLVGQSGNLLQNNDGSMCLINQCGIWNWS